MVFWADNLLSEIQTTVSFGVILRVVKFFSEPLGWNGVLSEIQTNVSFGLILRRCGARDEPRWFGTYGSSSN